MLHSMRETIGMNKRAIGIWWRESPGMLVELIFYVITGAVLPYAGIYFSAQIITELAGAKNPVVLRNLVLLLLGIESLLGLIYHYFKNRYTVERNRMLEKLSKILYLIFDYPHKHYTFKHFEVYRNTYFTTNLPRLNEP